MSHASRKQAKSGRLQPYAWLGAGAVTLGMGVVMVGGTAVAIADTGTDTGTAGTAAASTDSPALTSSADSSKKPAARGPRRAAANQAPSAATRGRGLPAAVAALAPAATRVSGGSQQSTSEAAGSASSTAKTAASVPNPAADPSYNMTSWLPPEPIVPGAHVTLARAEIAAAKADLQQQTFGSGKSFAGVAALGPQLLLSTAALALQNWQDNMPAAQQQFANTAGNPFMHAIANANLTVTMTLPQLAQASLSGAALLMPLVNMLGAATTVTDEKIRQARTDGQVYAMVRVKMKATTEPVVYISVNGGKKIPVLLDSGSSGLVLTQDSLGPGDLGPATGTGTSGYSGGLTYNYTTYDTSVNFGGAAVTGRTGVNVVDAADAQAFKDYLAPAGVVGVLGVGANTAGPGPSIPNTALPGELSDGFLIDETRGFGLFGVMILGPNPYPVRASLPGAPDAYVKVKINDGPLQNANAIIDTGGVYGTLPDNLIGGGSTVPSGTKISVYNADGSTLLYSYTVKGSNVPTVVPAGDLMNTGYTPFQQGPVYFNYAASAAPGGIGSTDFVWT